MVTLSDVARAAGVSLSTASRAINGSRDRTVKPHLRDRVLVAAAELNYSANATAQAMARGRTTTIGLMVHDITDPYFSGIAAGVTRAARDRGCVVTLATTDRQLSEQLTIIDVLRGQRVAALIMAGGLHDDPRDIGALAEALARFTESTGSNVTVIGQDRLGVATVGIGNHSGAKALAEALVAEGARRFAVLCGPPGNLTGRERLEGFVEGVGEAGSVVPVPGPFNRDGGYDAMREVIDSGELPDVVFAVTDVMAVGALAAARDAGVAVPADVKVAGFDDIPTLRDIVPALTTVRVPLEELGVLAVQLVMDPPDDSPTHIEVPTRVVLRASTGG